MSEKNTGGAAFPVATWSNEKMRYVDDGMTLRDYFASRAPTMPEWFSDLLAGEGTYVGPDMAEALWRYHHADLMLKAREA